MTCKFKHVEISEKFMKYCIFTSKGLHPIDLSIISEVVVPGIAERNQLSLTEAVLVAAITEDLVNIS